MIKFRPPLTPSLHLFHSEPRSIVSDQDFFGENLIDQEPISEPEAEIPVVTPEAASIETVKFVE